MKLTEHRKIELGFLFSIGLLIVAITAVRMPKTYEEDTSETYRVTWIAAELLAATFVANALTLYSFRTQLLRRREQRASRSSKEGGGRIMSDLDGSTRVEDNASGIAYSSLVVSNYPLVTSSCQCFAGFDIVKA
jgi:hypothetical protein